MCRPLAKSRTISNHEADFFFSKKEEIDAVREIDAKHIKKIPHKVQYILFSATYPETVKEAISLVVKEAQQINIRKELLQLDHIK